GGWVGMMVPEEVGGRGGSFLDLVVILEETGKSLLPGPFFATALLGSTTILAGGSAAQKSAVLPKVVEGNHILTLAMAEKSGRYDAAGVALAAKPKGNDFVLSGEKLFVPDAHVADQLIVAARTAQGGNPEDGVTLFLVDAKAPGVT